MNNELFITIDFDGTVTEVDITDAVIKQFAKPGWEDAEKLWESGSIGSRDCLSLQMSLIDAPLVEVLEHAGKFSVHESFPAFVHFLQKHQVPFCIVSDGFEAIIYKILSDAGLYGIPVFANILSDGEKGLKSSFPYSHQNCSSGTCKCSVARQVRNGCSLIHIGDGQSDYCLSNNAYHVFSKGKLTGYCRDNVIPHTAFEDFGSVAAGIEMLLLQELFSEDQNIFAECEKGGGNSVLVHIDSGRPSRA